MTSARKAIASFTKAISQMTPIYPLPKPTNDDADAKHWETTQDGALVFHPKGISSPVFSPSYGSYDGVLFHPTTTPTFTSLAAKLWTKKLFTEVLQETTAK